MCYNGDITAADIKALLNKLMNNNYAYTIVKKVHNIMHDYFRYLTEEELIAKNPMTSAPMIKKANFMATQDKETLPENMTVTVFTPEEIERCKAKCFRCWNNGKRIYQQAAAYIFMLNTGLRTSEMLGLLNSDINFENRVIHLNWGMKEVVRCDRTEKTSGMEMQVGKLKTAFNKSDKPLNSTDVAMVEELEKERYFGEEKTLVSDENGGFMRLVNFRKRYYRILEAAGIEQKVLHSLRHTFATSLVNGVKKMDGTMRLLSPKQVINLLGYSTSEITEFYYVKKDNNRRDFFSKSQIVIKKLEGFKCFTIKPNKDFV